LLDAEHAGLLERHGFERIEHGNLVNKYMRSFEDTRRKALKFGAQGATGPSSVPDPGSRSDPTV
jgi:hypothetical protein